MDPPHPGGAEDQPAEGVKPETEEKRRFPRIGVVEAGVRDIAGGTGAATIGYCQWVEAVVLGRIGAGLALGGAAFLALPFGHDYRLPLFNVALPGSREIIHRYI